jgi:hypothetical protein
MSYQAWKEEFYPVDAEHVTTWKEAVDQSIMKWEGLRAENLKKHDIKIQSNYIFDQNLGVELRCDYTSCALCQMSKKVDQSEVNCNYCPLALVSSSCQSFEGPDEFDDAEYSEENTMNADPYTIWLDWKDPSPMIDALLEAKTFVENNTFGVNNQAWSYNDTTE